MDTFWFKRRRYGFGWTPVTWQGWLAVGLYVAVVWAAASAFLGGSADFERWLFYMICAIATSQFIFISLRHGPKPRWRWGWRAGDNPGEDV